ncbi:MAG: ABC transporter ATP-binding protein [Planctomycetes bacterium]|nr:ABC transporter ATP-binding protein [Planctomycetota bacterium]
MPEQPDAAEANGEPLLRVEHLCKHFTVSAGLFGRHKATLRAVEDVSFSIHSGRTLGLVGESGCGKTTLGRTILRLIPPTSGRVYFDGVDVFALGRAELRRLRPAMQIIFQDPAGSLNPRMTVASIVGEGLRVHGVRGRERNGGRSGAAAAPRLKPSDREVRERVATLLQRVGLSADDMPRFPHEFSGGQRQRIGIARALALQPRLLVCDEPVSALDVSIQAQILNLLAELRSAFELTCLFIAHNLAVVRHFCDEVAVMYLGRIVEQAPADELFRRPAHPYTRLLMAAALEPDPTRAGEPVLIRGEVPSPSDPPSGCAFHPRCPHAEARCRTETPPLTRRAGLTIGHVAACHRADEPSWPDGAGAIRLP